MNIMIDGQQGFEFDTQPKDVLTAVVVVSDFLRKQNRAIMRVRFDGQEVPAAKLEEAFEGLAIDQVSELLIESEELVTLVDSSLSELEDALPELPRACHSLAEVFQGEAPQEGFDPFIQLMGIWEQIKAREQLVVRTLDLAPDTIDFEGKTLEQHHAELNGYLEEAEAALREQDGVLLGDLLEYELAPRAEQEARIVALLKEQARERVQQ